MPATRELSFDRAHAGSPPGRNTATKVLLRVAIGLLLIEAGFFAHARLDRHRSDTSAFLPPTTPDHRRSIRVVLLLGEDDCRDALSFADLLEAVVTDHSRASQIVVVAGSANALLLARAKLENRTTNLPIVQATPRQLRTLGVRPARRLARLLLVDSHGNTLFQTLVPASPTEVAAVVSLTAAIVQRELARS